MLVVEEEVLVFLAMLVPDLVVREEVLLVDHLVVMLQPLVLMELVVAAAEVVDIPQQDMLQVQAVTVL
jgi:hypothetical protein